jgi:small subunit ribosomal protein S16
VAVKIRLKRLGRTHRPYYRICIMDGRSPRDGKAIEEVGTYDPMIPDVDKSVTMKSDRIDYWLSVGAQPTPKVGTLIKKYKGNVPDKRVEKRKIPKMAERLSAEPRQSAEAPSSEAAPTATVEGET